MTDSPVLDAWALVAGLQQQGVDALGALDQLQGASARNAVELPTRISSKGLPVITRQEIQGMGTDRVAEYFYDRVLSAAMAGSAEWEETTERLRNLPRTWRLVYTLCWLQAQVDNGGHEQFFSNGRGGFDDETEADLRLIGADQFLNLFNEARRCYYCEPAGSMERIPEITPLDDAFYKQKKSLFTLVGEHVLSHVSDYCVN